MSLTLFVHNTDPIYIVRWFLETRGQVLYACGPLVEMPLREFRASGHEWINQHFVEFESVRLDRRNIIKPFEAREAKKIMGKRRAVEIHKGTSSCLIISPMVVEKFSLRDLRRVLPLSEQTVLNNSPSTVFWSTFERVLADAPIAGY